MTDAEAIAAQLALRLGDPRDRVHARIAALRYAARYLAGIDETSAALKCDQRARELQATLARDPAPPARPDPEVDVTVWDDPDAAG